MAKQFSIGKRVAPARFLVFFAMLFVSVAVATIVAPWWRSVMLGFNFSALVFIGSCLRLYDDEAVGSKN